MLLTHCDEATVLLAMFENVTKTETGFGGAKPNLENKLKLNDYIISRLNLSH